MPSFLSLPDEVIESVCQKLLLHLPPQDLWATTLAPIGASSEEYRQAFWTLMLINKRMQDITIRAASQRPTLMLPLETQEDSYLRLLFKPRWNLLKRARQVIIRLEANLSVNARQISAELATIQFPPNIKFRCDVQPIKDADREQLVPILADLRLLPSNHLTLRLPLLIGSIDKLELNRWSALKSLALMGIHFRGTLKINRMEIEHLFVRDCIFYDGLEDAFLRCFKPTKSFAGYSTFLETQAGVWKRLRLASQANTAHELPPRVGTDWLPGYEGDLYGESFDKVTELVLQGPTEADLAASSGEILESLSKLPEHLEKLQIDFQTSQHACATIFALIALLANSTWLPQLRHLAVNRDMDACPPFIMDQLVNAASSRGVFAEYGEAQIWEI